ncbi:hypothetical protein [Aquimarina aggregata]|uniref:hypothetical protein n=1 Tax=Aquimarina aggregata TaxID=1642818 RepID=UPI0024921386|nr:hypothetical protein [Aquimarina aggregata]
MKTLKYVLLAVLLGINLISCEAPPLNEEVGIEEVEILDTDVFGTKGSDQELEEDEG